MLTGEADVSRSQVSRTPPPPPPPLDKYFPSAAAAAAAATLGRRHLTDFSDALIGRRA